MNSEKDVMADASAMRTSMHALAVYGATPLFVLLWSGGAIFSRVGLSHASPFAFLTLRFVIALTLLAAIGVARRRVLPAPGTRVRVAVTGALMIGGYSISYLLALDFGMTPGVLATVLGVQPILTLLWMERRVSVARLAGLTLALAGLVTIVADSLMAARFSMAGWGAALAALACMTVGAIGQKGIRQAPVEILPLQYTVALAMCLLCVPFQPFRFEHVPGFFFPLLWMGIVISVVATLLFYRLIQAGNLVNVTSLFYLVPPVTVLLDFVALSNRPAPLALVGMIAIPVGLALVFRAGR
ncbi:MAG: EamA/RhaT family transporter [Burkholderiaceae bacterium]|jgi:drug/metabolite transporter (DMT)-like permease|uniref:DMT family transporter n=2 Tax=Burkholderiaceae TaxID=119060 RepID=A0A482J3R8_9BURK|nr:multidrug DMT transporter permease [Cupriavidus sp. SHE]PCH57306.1 MAG: EamA/RhaT family transporter [Burkholderiaceae bacterium]QBP13670.1 DMT family transporter [Cupriavidus metallidurans]